MVLWSSHDGGRHAGGWANDRGAAGKEVYSRSRSPWGSPMFLVAKPDGERRMVIDFRALNAATTRNRYPLPRVDELFDQLQGARYFSKLDLRTGYWQIRVAEEDVPKTAFTSRHGHYEWLVLPMGLTNAPAEFMALMETTFREELNKFVLVFLDDILVYNKTLKEHERHWAWCCNGCANRNCTPSSVNAASFVRKWSSSDTSLDAPVCAWWREKSPQWSAGRRPARRRRWSSSWDSRAISPFHRWL